MSDPSERRKTDILLIQSVARIEEKLKVLNKHSIDIEEIKKILTDHRFQRLMINAGRIGDQEEIMRIMSDEYYGISGFKALPIALNKIAHDIKVKTELEKSIIKATGRWMVQFCSKALPIIIVTSIFVVSIVWAMLNNYHPFK
jgi:hypothetical protein